MPRRLTPHAQRSVTEKHDRARLDTVELVASLLELAKDPVFVFGADGGLVATNAAARAVLAESESAWLTLVSSSDVATVDSASGPLRVTRKELATKGGVHHVALLEPAVADVGEVLGLATAAWQLTTRQAEVLQGVLDGLSNKEIAKKVGTSHRTIEVHVTALLAKSGAERRARLVVKARALAGS